MSTELIMQDMVEMSPIVTVQELQQLVQAAMLSSCPPVPAMTLQCSPWTIELKLEFLQQMPVTLCQVRGGTNTSSVLSNDKEI